MAEQFMRKRHNMILTDQGFAMNVMMAAYPQDKKLSYHWQTARRVWRSVKVTKHVTIPYVRYGFLFVSYSNFVRKTHIEIFDFKNAVTMMTGLRVREGHW